MWGWGEPRVDGEAYGDGPDLGDIADSAGSVYQGLYLAPGSDDAKPCSVVHHGFRESIEFFEVDAGTARRASPEPAARRPRRGPA